MKEKITPLELFWITIYFEHEKKKLTLQEEAAGNYKPNFDGLYENLIINSKYYPIDTRFCIFHFMANDEGGDGVFLLEASGTKIVDEIHSGYMQEKMP